MSFEIMTESCANIPIALIDKFHIQILPMANIVNGEERLNFGRDTDEMKRDLYDGMRKKINVSTSCISKHSVLEIAEPILEKGIDLLYVGFSSGLSASYGVAQATLEELQLKYKDRKIFYVDSLAASMGHARLVTFAAEKRDAKESIEDTAKWLEDNKQKLCHLFTVDNLVYLYRGGRVKKSGYLIGTTLNIKPVMHVNEEGRLVPIAKALGRKKSLCDIATRLAENIVDSENQTIYISHGDCLDDAQFLVSKVKELVTVKDFVIDTLDLVIGSHSGPGTVAIFFLGKHK